MKIEQHEPHKTLRVKLVALEVQALPALLEAPVVIVFVNIFSLSKVVL